MDSDSSDEEMIEQCPQEGLYYSNGDSSGRGVAVLNFADGTQHHYLDGVLHRGMGLPAVTANNTMEWWTFGRKIYGSWEDQARNSCPGLNICRKQYMATQSAIAIVELQHFMRVRAFVNGCCSNDIRCLFNKTVLLYQRFVTGDASFDTEQVRWGTSIRLL